MNEQVKSDVPRPWTLPFITAADRSRGCDTTRMPDEREVVIPKEQWLYRKSGSAQWMLRMSSMQ